MVIHQFALRSTTQADRPDSLAAKSSGIRGRPIAELPDSEPCYEQIHAWMRNCLYNHHMSCPAPQVSTLLPTRVIDVRPTDTPDVPKVLKTSRQPGAFIALSHCWGTKTRFILESNTKTELLRGMAMDVLPPTFRDAIKVTRALGYRYLWIDSLCIMQDSHDDWEYESGRMQEYYTNATLTIALDDTEGDHQGFLDRIRLSDKTATAIPFNISEPDNGGELPSNPHNNKSVYLSHNRSRVVPSSTGGYLARRGWTLQEDILSVRTVHYEDGRLHWGCQDLLVFEGLACEFSGQGHLKYNFLLSLGSLNTGTYHPTWYNIVETYLQRDLTLVEDKFPAISGIAKAVEKRTGLEYRAGIWLEDFHCGLSWFIEGRSEREKTYVAPSWSWASIKTPINHATPAIHGVQTHWTREVDDNLPMLLQLIDCKVVSRGSDPFGQITHAFIVLRGMLLQFSKWPAKHPVRIGTSFGTRPGFLPWSINCNFDEPIFTHDCGPGGDIIIDPGAHILEILHLLHIYGTAKHPSYLLILMPTTTEGEFRRVGLAHAEIDAVKAAAEWEIRDVTII